MKKLTGRDYEFTMRVMKLQHLDEIDKLVPTSYHLNDKGRLHSVEGPAITFDKFSWEKLDYEFYFLNGISFSKKYFYKFVFGKKAKPQDILGLKNQEQKTALIKYYGFEYVFDFLPNLKVIDQEKVNGKNHYLYSFSFTESSEDVRGINARQVLGRAMAPVMASGAVSVGIGAWAWNVEYKFLKLEDHSTDKIYYLGVPPEIRTIKEGLAWTFGLEVGQYNPVQQT